MTHPKRTKVELEATISAGLHVACIHWTRYWDAQDRIIRHLTPPTTAIMTLNLLETDLRAYRLLRERENAGNLRNLRGERTV